MSTEVATIGPGRRVRLHLAVYLEDGTEALSSFGDEPIHFRVGDGTVAPGIEAMLTGLKPGAHEQLLADGASLFGAYDPTLIHWIARTDLPPSFDADPGQVIQFQAPGGQETPGTILSVNETEVEVDFNHPFARRGLRIRAQVLDVF